MLPEIQISDLKKNFLSERIDAFIEIDKVIGHELWGQENFLSEMPDKWDLSLVALFNDELIGYLIASRKELSIHIHRLAIDQQFQSAGVGKSMVSKLVTKAKLWKLPISLKVHYENLHAIAFYQKIGFKVVGKSNSNLEMQFLIS